MEHPSFRTLAATFLVVATATSSFSFFFSSSFSAHSSAPPQDVQATVPINAIGTEAIPPAALSSEPLTLTDLALQPLFNELSKSASPKKLLQLIQENPNASVASLAQQAANFEELNIPFHRISQELQAAEAAYENKIEKLVSQHFKTDASVTPAVYFASIQAALQALSDFIEQNPPSFSNPQSVLVALDTVLNKTTADLEAIAAPPALSSFHKKLLFFFEGQREAFHLILQPADSDPLKALLLFKAMEIKFKNTLQELAQEIPAALPPASKVSGKFQAAVQALFFINTAYANVPVFDFSNLMAKLEHIAQYVANMLGAIAEELAKHELMQIITEQTVNWIRGGGTPKFVTDWKGFLREAMKRAISKTISESAPFLCQSFGPLITIAAIPPPNIPPEEGVECTLEDAVRNVKAFYQNFEAGGWVAYAEALKPQNNILGIITTLQDKSTREAEQEKESEKSDAESSNGFLSIRTCTESHSATIAPDSDPRQVFGKDYVKGSKKCNGSSCTVSVCDKWENKTPGEFVGSTLIQEVGKERIEQIASTLHIDPSMIETFVMEVGKALYDTFLTKIENGLGLNR